MGWVNNECVIASTEISKYMDVIKSKAKLLEKEEQSLIAFLPSLVNGKQTVIIAPDGSKTGWSNDLVGDALRNWLIDLIGEFDYDDGSNPFQWVEVGFGDFGQKILRGNNKNQINNKRYATN